MSFEEQLLQLIIQFGVVALHDKLSNNEQSVWTTKLLPAIKLLSWGPCKVFGSLLLRSIQLYGLDVLSFAENGKKKNNGFIHLNSYFWNNGFGMDVAVFLNNLLLGLRKRTLRTISQSIIVLQTSFQSQRE